MKEDGSLIFNTPSMPVKAENGVYDTSGDYKKETVSYGSGYSNSLADGTKYSFAEKKLKNVTRIEERNLIHCYFLNLDESSVL